MMHPQQETMGDLIIEYFCEGVSYTAWDKHMDQVADRPRFVGSVSRRFAKKLDELKMSRKLKRRELNSPV